MTRRKLLHYARRFYLLVAGIISAIFFFLPVPENTLNGLLLFIGGGAVLFLWADFATDGKIDGDFDRSN